MAPVKKWNGIPVERAPGEGVSLPSNVEGVPEDAPHYYRAPDGKLQVVASRDEPPEEYKAPGWHFIVTGEAIWPEPHAGYREDGTVGTSGFKPDGTWVEATPAKELTPEEKAAKAFHDAMANPSSLVRSATPDKLTAFAATVLDAARTFLFPEVK